MHCFKSTLEAQTALLALAGLAFSPSWGDESPGPPVVIKFSHVVAPDTPKGKGAEYFKKLVEQRTQGRVKVEVYPNSQLYKDKEELEALQLGSVQMLAPSVSKFGPMGVKAFEVFDLPYLFEGYEAAHKITHGPIGASMLRQLQQHGMIGLGFWDNGFKEFTANKPLRRPEDFRGLKFRVKSSKVLEAQMRALGAIPQVMAFSEVYQALQTGVVDGAETSPVNIVTQRWHEVQKFMSLSHHGYDAYAIVVNRKFWDSLAPELRSTLEQALNDATRYVEGMSATEEADAIDAIRASGKCQVIDLTAEERAALKRVLQPVHQQMADRVGRELLDSIYSATRTGQK
ncbi:MAG TPA: TRAP transporter substrate-binding protein [Burkholderiaceae bacterium]|nr:TRAP transporter substrate-binding protein [Burkholderiaceae bacterium]